jgi:hypothetical protein
VDKSVEVLLTNWREATGPILGVPTGMPGPLHKRIADHVLLQLRNRTAAIVARIGQLPAERGDIERFPLLACRRHAPIRGARHSTGRIVVGTVAGRTSHAGSTVIAHPTHHVQTMPVTVVALAREIR